ncbi:hypothetical protein AK812_SmicGene41555 [Symbiodinium microadriaticum]|uniref:Uncharacterized protein n=1 Tax=Symbiodinium microadriaticum TaxID=2951 RepID=A0A1Q9C5S9_SYMMI|nr:hypothetical protein AK812_SmicGene41555 [Symbiodinium microadriaticum]
MLSLMTVRHEVHHHPGLCVTNPLVDWSNEHCRFGAASSSGSNVVRASDTTDEAALMQGQASLFNGPDMNNTSSSTTTVNELSVSTGLFLDWTDCQTSLISSMHPMVMWTSTTSSTSTVENATLSTPNSFSPVEVMWWMFYVVFLADNVASTTSTACLAKPWRNSWSGWGVLIQLYPFMLQQWNATFGKASTPFAQLTHYDRRALGHVSDDGTAGHYRWISTTLWRQHARRLHVQEGRRVPDESGTNRGDQELCTIQRREDEAAEAANVAGAGASLDAVVEQAVGVEEASHAVCLVVDVDAGDVDAFAACATPTECPCEELSD